MADVTISTIQDLVSFSNGDYGRGTSSAYLDVVLTADLDFADLNEYDSPYNWAGCTGTWYVNFDGQGHKVDNIYYMGTAAWGFFGTVYGTVENLNLTNMYITVTANATAAGIATNSGATIRNCHVSGFIESLSYVACGIVGFRSGADPIIRECSFSGTLRSYYATCGIICTGGAGIYNCLVTGELINRGELVIFWGSSDCAMINCVFRAKVTAPSSRITYNGRAAAYQCYFVILEGSSGNVSNAGTLVNVFYDSDKVTAAGITVSAGTAATTVQLKDPVWLKEHGFAI